MTEELLKQGYKKFIGTEINIFFSKEKCVHLAFCLRCDPQVFNLGRRPWILPDAGEKENVKKVVDMCTSNALLYIEK